jgi:SAM-dependent methyltransferase
MGTAQVQGDLWGARARDWADLQEAAFGPLYEAAFDAAEVTKGTALLDVGCGAGLACELAHRRGAHVSGLDASAALVEIAAARCTACDVRAGEIEELPFEEGSFDVVTGFNSFQYASDPVHALAEAKRVGKRDGYVIVAVWGSAENCELASYVAALGQCLPPPPPGAPGPFALSAPGALETLVSKAGLKPGQTSRVMIDMYFPNEQIALRGLLAPGVAVRAIRAAGEETVRKAAAEAIRPYRKANGSYSFRNEFRFQKARI